MIITDIASSQSPWWIGCVFTFFWGRTILCKHVCHLYLFLNYLLVLCTHFPLLSLCIIYQFVGALKVLRIMLLYWLAASNFSSLYFVCLYYFFYTFLEDSWCTYLKCSILWVLKYVYVSETIITIRITCIFITQQRVLEALGYPSFLCPPP